MMNKCLIPTPKPDFDGDTRWESMHNRFVSDTKKSEFEVLWIGDSITQQMQFCTLWKSKISGLHCGNFGIGGDRVEHILWRIENGELDFSFDLKAIILHVGTNNTDNNAQEIFEGILNIVEKIRSKQENAALILLTLLPRGQCPNKVREKNLQVNNLLMEEFAQKQEKNLHLVLIHENIVQEDGTISHHVLYDYLHLTDFAYSKIFTPVYEKLLEILEEKENFKQ